MASAPLAERFREHLDQAGLLTGPGLAVVAVSGGPDSMALLALLAGCATDRAVALLVAHADHGIHAASGEVAESVARTARDRFGLDAVVGRLELGPAAGETRSRAARYRFLRRVQHDRGARWLVTAHHADDQAETVLLRLLRGSAPAGLAGMAAAGPRGLVRPLLPFGRGELAEFARASGLATVTDPANSDLRHARSWIRGRVLPLLEERLGPDARQALLNVARHAAADLAAWDAALGVLPGLDLRVSHERVDVARAALSGYDSALAARVIRAAGRRAGLVVRPSQAVRIAQFAATAASGRRLELGGRLWAEASFGRLVIGRPEPVPEPLALMLAPAGTGSAPGEAGQAQFGRYRIVWRFEPAPERLPRSGWTSWFQPGNVEVRRPAPGARIVPLGGNGHRTVARLLMEGRVPRTDRAGWPLVVRDGIPLWIPGVCRGQEAVPAPGTLAVRMDLAPAE